MERAASNLPAAIAEVMTIITAAIRTGEGRLSDDELLTRYEQIVSEWQTRTLAAGLALAEIRDRRSSTRSATKTSSRTTKSIGAVSAEAARASS